MGKSIFQIAADWIEQPEPIWLKNATQDLQNVMIQLAIAAGKGWLQMVASEAVAVASNNALTGPQKFNQVYMTAMDPNNTVKPLKDLASSEATTLINGVVSILKMSGEIS